MRWKETNRFPAVAVRTLDAQFAEALRSSERNLSSGIIKL
jgi:hypothetical protein